jgi:two-component system response regulator RpfG
MSAQPKNSMPGSGVVSELAFARAQRNTVLIVDDLFSSRLLLAEIVRQIDGKLNLELFDTPSRALEFARNNRVDIVLTDYKLPEFDGIELVKQLRALPHCVDVPIVVITVVDDRKIRYDALEAGATDFLIKPLDEHETRARCANLLELRRHKIVLSDQARVLQYQVDKSVAEIHERELETLSKLAKAGEFRDKTTGNHLMRMAKYSALIGAHLGLGNETVHVLEVAAPMHDIGKIGIPDSVLLKEGPLTKEEIEVMKVHPRIGYDILKGSPSKYLSMGAIIALGHHEKFDGNGYPNGLHGEDIPLVARVVAVADVFDALVSQRPYKHAWPIDESIEFVKGAARQAFRSDLRRRVPRRSHQDRGHHRGIRGLRSLDSGHDAKATNRGPRPTPPPVRQILNFVPASRRLLQIVWPFLAVVVLLAILSAVSTSIMSSVRAYVGGESLWSKRRKSRWSRSIATRRRIPRRSSSGTRPPSPFHWAIAARVRNWTGPRPTSPSPARVSSTAATILTTSTA